MKFKDFQDTGRFVPVEKFKRTHKTKVVDNRTTDVVVYLDKYYIEVRKPSTFFINGFESENLDAVEKQLWDTVEKVINN